MLRDVGHMQVMCWGVRNMKRYQLATVTSPNVEFEIGGYMTQTKLIPDTNKNPNFDEPLLFLDIVMMFLLFMIHYCCITFSSSLC